MIKYQLKPDLIININYMQCTIGKKNNRKAYERTPLGIVMECQCNVISKPQGTPSSKNS